MSDIAQEIDWRGKPAPEPDQSAADAQEEPKFKPLSVRTLSEIIGMVFDPADLLLENGYLTKGNPLSLVGMGGLGKSRFVMQMAIACILGRPFIGWETKATGQKWLILQTENSNRRLQADLSRMVKTCTPDELARLDGGLRIHTLETEDDTFVSLSNPETGERIAALLRDFNANVIVFDVLRDFGTGDLNTDVFMTETCRAIGRITRDGDPTRIPLVVHHALTGKAGAAKATGFDRGSFGRNSKVLQGWARAQINLAPFSPDTNDVLVVAMSYDVDESVDLAEWQEQITGTAKTPAKASVQDVIEAVKSCGIDGISKRKLVASVMAETGCSGSLAYRHVATAEETKAILRRKSDKFYVTK